MKKTLICVLLLCFLMTFAGCGTKEEPTVSDAAQSVPQSDVSVPADDEPIPEEDVMVPIYADALKDGSYLITVDSSSSMFRVIKCELIVEDGAMRAVMTMSGNGYGMVYMGTGEEALLDSEDHYIPFELDAEEAKNFTVPVEALDMELDCAAWSIRKEKWYDRTLIFESTELPAEAWIGA